MGMVTRMMATTVPFTPSTYDSIFPARVGAVAVTSESSLTIPAVYACVTVISETIGSVPLQVFEQLGDGKKLARNHPLYDLLHEQPNRYQSALEFREMMTAFALLRARGIAEIIPGPRGPVDQLKPLHPDLVWSEVTEGGALRYKYADPVTKTLRILLPDEVFVIRGRFGRSVIDYARVTLGAQLAMTSHQTDMYNRGVRFPGALKHRKELNDVQRGHLRDAIDEYVIGGPRSGRPLLLEDGMDWQTIGMTNEDAQFVETAQLGISDVCRYFRVQPHKIAHLINATFSNIEHQAIEFVTDTIRPWAIRWEQAIRRDLILAPHRFFVEHNLDALQRGDIATRYAAYAIGRQWGWLSTNDIRRRENMNPISDGDEDYLTPLNMAPTSGTALVASMNAQQGVEGALSPIVAGVISAALAQPVGRANAMGQQLRGMVWDAAARVVRKESDRVAKWAANGRDETTLTAFYDEHARFVAQLLHLSEEDAEHYCRDRLLLASADGLPDDLDSITALTELALDKADLRLPKEDAA